VWQVEQALICPGCGHSIYQSHDAAHEGEYVAEAVRCFACKARGLAAEDFADNTANSPHGIKWHTTLRR
jgi:hypothetical protein